MSTINHHRTKSTVAAILLAAALTGCGGSDEPSAACADAMSELAVTDFDSNALQPAVDATFESCETAEEWNAAAEDHRTTDVDGVGVIVGPNTSADSVRLALCANTTPEPPACS